jgi:hypothetical protein
VIVAGYLPGEAEGAYPIGTRIVKVRLEEGDGTPLGTGGEVIASHYAGHIPPTDGVTPATYFYFVMWDDFPAPVGVLDWKIGKEVE